MKTREEEEEGGGGETGLCGKERHKHVKHEAEKKQGGGKGGHK